MSESESAPGAGFAGALRARVAIVTGAARGIGREIAASMARAGAAVVLADVDGERLAEAVSDLEAAGAVAVGLCADVSCPADNERLVADTLARFGRIDILVNNAGINVDEDVLGLSADGLMKVLQTNFAGPALLTSRVAGAMIERQIRGVLLFTSSVHGRIVQMRPGYSCSKAALEMFVREAAIQLAPHGIRANAVAPGGIAVRGERDTSHPDVPLGRRGAPGDVAALMVFLASDLGGYITGQTLTVDGGLSLHAVSSLRRYGKLD